MQNGWLDTHRNLVIFGLFVLSVIVRIITAEYIEIGGDNSARWMFAVDLVQGHDSISWSHHTSRWAIIMPLAALLKLVGTNPAYYYVLPVLAASVGVIMLYLIGEKLEGAKLGVVAGVLTIFFPQMAQSGSQLWPSVFMFMYISFAVWLLVRNEHPSNLTIILVAVAFFLAWGARLTAVYFFPGLVIMIWLPQHNWRAVVLFTGAVGMLCCIEWYAFWHFSGNVMGRIGIVSHTIGSVHVVYETFLEYALNIKELLKLKGLLPVFILAVVASVAMLFQKDVHWRGLAVMYLISIFLLVYMLGGIFPLKRAGDPSSRVWCSSAPFGLLLLSHWLLKIGERRALVSKVLIGILLVAFLGFSIKKIPADNAVRQVAQDHSILSPVLTAKQPVLLHWQPWSPNFIESMLYSLFNVSKKPRGSKKSHVFEALRRGKSRMLAYNLEDVSLYQHYRDDGQLIEKGPFLFLYIPPGATTIEPVANVYFDRRAARAELIN